MVRPAKPIAIFYEHQEWFKPLFTELERRGTRFLKLDARQHRYYVASPDGDFSLLFNRMSPSAYVRGNGHGIFYTLNYLAPFEHAALRVVNGTAAFTFHGSTA